MVIIRQQVFTAGEAPKLNQVHLQAQKPADEVLGILMGKVYGFPE